MVGFAHLTLWVLEKWHLLSFLDEKFGLHEHLPAWSSVAVRHLADTPWPFVGLFVVGLFFVAMAEWRAADDRLWEGTADLAPRHSAGDLGSSYSDISLSKDGGYYWWHVDVGFSGDSGEVDVRTPFVLFRQPKGVKELKMMWSTSDGPKEQLVLKDSGVHHIPVAARAEKGEIMVYAAQNLPPFHIPAGIARVTDYNAMIRRSAYTDLPPGTHVFRVCLKDARDSMLWMRRRRWGWLLRFFGPHVEPPVVSRPYLLHVPLEGESNERFALVPLSLPVSL